MSTVMAKKKSKKSQQLTDSVKGLELLDLIPPEEIMLLQRGVFNVVKQNMSRVREVLAGTRTWNNQQTKIYLTLLDKVMPDLSQSYNVHEHRDRGVNDMSPEELRVLIAEQLGMATIASKMDPNDPDIPLHPVIAVVMPDPLALTDKDLE